MPKHPNILYLITDEQRADSLGEGGAPWASTPHLDTFARSGTRFSAAYTPSPVCVSARAALVTGRACSGRAPQPLGRSRLRRNRAGSHRPHRRLEPQPHHHSTEEPETDKALRSLRQRLRQPQSVLVGDSRYRSSMFMTAGRKKRSRLPATVTTPLAAYRGKSPTASTMGPTTASPRGILSWHRLRTRPRTRPWTPGGMEP